jgi:hypothetical protein
VDLYRIGNYLLAAEGPKPRPGWPEALKSENLTAEYLDGSWLLDTTHLVMDDVPQPHKCATPDTLRRRFETLGELSGGRMWAATIDDVIDCILLRRALRIENVRCERPGQVRFDVLGAWPVGLVNALLTVRVSGMDFPRAPQVLQGGLPDAPCGMHRKYIDRVEADGADWLITLELAPGRTVTLET